MPSKQDKSYEDRLQAALKELSLQPKLSLPLTAKRFDVAERTLHDRKNGRRQPPQKAYLHECLLNPHQEQALVKWICMQDDRGIPPRLDLVRDKVLAIIQQSQSKTSLGKHWLNRFTKRHSELQIRFSQHLERQRSAASNPRVLEHHFKLFHKALQEYKIKEANIWNMDEKGFLLGIAAKCRVICRKGRKNPKYTQDGNRELITVLEYVSAEGVVLPPLVVTKGANHYIGMHIRGQGGPGWVYAHSPKGWTSNEIGLGWLEDTFESKTRPE
jgi:Tc5 transposase DNA-binding domain